MLSLIVIALVLITTHAESYYNNDIKTNVRGTFWSEQTDAGGCSLPGANYGVLDAIALGQGDALGDLKYRPGLCGKVVNIVCDGGEVVQAVIASTCDIGSSNCGVDMIGRTWRKATGGASPGEAVCKVSLAMRNPIQEVGPICYFRDSPGSPYYQNLGVMNNGLEVVASATLAGIQGKWSNGAWIDFNSNGKNLFTPDKKVTFTYESGKEVSFHLSECKVGVDGVHIFK